MFYKDFSYTIFYFSRKACRMPKVGERLPEECYRGEDDGGRKWAWAMAGRVAAHPRESIAEAPAGHSPPFPTAGRPCPAKPSHRASPSAAIVSDGGMSDSVTPADSGRVCELIR
eukprot:266365-Hanusia_phi.AAC.2